MSGRSYLYVPADQPAMLAKAGTRGADALIVDLEDAVAPASKAAARDAMAAWLDRVGERDLLVPGVEVWVRVNSSRPDGAPPFDDLDRAVHPIVSGIVVAKCGSASELARLDEALADRERRAGLDLGSIRVAPLIETAAGVLALGSIATAARVARLQLGEADLAAELGMSPGADRVELFPIRLALVLHSAAAGLDPPVGPVHTELADEGGLRASTRVLARLGFVGRAAIHPRQVPVINTAFTPTAEELAAAAVIVERFDEGAARDEGVALGPDGSIIDAAVVRSARSVLRRGGAVPGRGDSVLGRFS